MTGAVGKGGDEGEDSFVGVNGMMTGTHQSHLARLLAWRSYTHCKHTLADVCVCVGGVYCVGYIGPSDGLRALAV